MINIQCSDGGKPYAVRLKITSHDRANNRKPTTSCNKCTW